MVAIKVADLNECNVVVDLSDREQQITGGGFYAQQAAKPEASLQYFLDGYKAGDYDLQIAEEDGKKYLSFYSVRLATGSGKDVRPAIGIFSLD